MTLGKQAKDRAFGAVATQGLTRRCVSMALLATVIAAVGSVSLPARALDPEDEEGWEERLPPGTRQMWDVEYAHPDGIPLQLDLLIPPSPRPVPLIIWIHGGGWNSGSRKDMPAVPLLQDGYAVASIDYRLSDVATFPAQIHDAKAAVRFLRANAKRFGLDPDHFGVWGESAGGHLAALLGVTSGKKALEGDEGITGVSSRVQAVADWYGPVDLANIAVGRLHKSMTKQQLDDIITQLLGKSPHDDRRLAARASPITYVTRGAPPFFVMHGDEDEVVPLHQSVLLVSALREAGTEVEFRVLKGAGHSGEDFFSPQAIERVRAFFDQYLKADR